MAMRRKEIKHIRKSAFSQKYEPDVALDRILGESKEFLFLKNPVVQNIFKYQIDYVRSFSQKWFENKRPKILDWGCGKGQISYWLKKMNEDVTSCDVTNTGITSAFVINSPLYKEANIDIVALQHDYILPFNDSSFDVVLSFGVLEHVPNDWESLGEIERILRPGGLFFCFYLPYTLSYTQHIAHLRGNWYHSRLYGKAQVKKLLEKANFELLDIWHRALLPKKSFTPPFYHAVEKMDNWLCNYGPLKYFATNLEFVAKKPE
jgi:SAM-dependent methyltransferase